MNGSAGSIAIFEAELRADGRGWWTALPPQALAFLGRVAECHWVSIEPGAVRGNHAHADRREVVLVRHDGPWRLAWSCPGGRPLERRFAGRGVVCVGFHPDLAHALRNEGPSALWVVSCSDRPATAEDTRRVVLLETLQGGTGAF